MSDLLDELLIKRAIKEKQLPQFLYKFRGIERAKEIISNSEFYFSDAVNFNDPFDTKLSEVRYSVRDWKKSIVEQGLPKSTINQLIKKAKKDSGFVNRHSENAVEKTRRDIGVLSLSKTYRNILLWSHYSQDHKGVAFELNVLEDLAFFVSPLSMDYVKGYEPLNYPKHGEKAVLKNLITKAEDWRYEQEIRIIKKTRGVVKINKNAIRKIIFGCNCKTDTVEKLIKLCGEKGFTSTQFFKAEKSYGKFELHFSKIT